ncbi:MAG: 1,2-phenylacetyl-CoA epoxidase subunit PaaD [Pseudomonadota bacterium]
MVTAAAPDIDSLRRSVEALPDPEIPVLTLGDLGIVRFVRDDGDTVVAGLAPTYSACPATEFIEAAASEVLNRDAGKPVRIERVLTPPWTTDWISAEGRRKLLAYGIAPPAAAAGSKRALLGEDRPAACPQCGSTETERVSEFGSTPCKAAYRCSSCLEPFDYFKCL